MYNTDIPTRAELPSSRQLFKSTMIAIVAAIAILVTIVLPSEYAVDPTGVGRMLNLTEMGEIKQQLAAEAEADRLKEQLEGDTSSMNGFWKGLGTLFIGSAHAQTTSEDWKDTVTFTLKPGEGVEYKLTMDEAAEVEFLWVSEGGVVNYDQHGDGSGQNISYEKGRGVSGQEGTLKAAFTGNHGWFWRNRTKNDVAVTLKIRGAYGQLLKMD